MKAYSEDLRERVVRAVAIGTPRDEVAAMFAVSSATITRWLRLKREAGSLAPKPVLGPAAVKTEALMAALPWSTWERLIIWMAIGLVIYFAYGRSHSKLRTANS